MDENKAKEEQTKVSKETDVAVDNNEETTMTLEENVVDAEETETEEDQNEERNPEDDFGGAKRPAIKNQQNISLLV